MVRATATVLFLVSLAAVCGAQQERHVTTVTGRVVRTGRFPAATPRSLPKTSSGPSRAPRAPPRPRADSPRTDTDGRALLRGDFPPRCEVQAWADGYGSAAATVIEGAVRIELPRPVDRKWTIVESERPAPADGTVLRLVERQGERRAVGEAVVRGNAVVVSGAGGEFVRAIGLSPDGSIAKLQPDGTATFHARRTLTVDLIHDDGSPAAGLELTLIGEIRHSATTDARGRARFAGLAPTVSSRLEAAGVSTGDLDLGMVDFREPEVQVAREIRRPSPCTIELTIDGLPRLPDHYALETYLAWCGTITEDPERGRLTFPFIPADGKPVGVRIEGRGLVPTSFTIRPGAPGAPITADVALTSAAVLSLGLRTKDSWRLQRWDVAAGDWDGGRDLFGGRGGVRLRHWHLDDLAPGLYRLRDRGYGEAETTSRCFRIEGRTKLTLDMTRRIAVSGQVHVPAGERAELATVLPEIDGFSTGDALDRRLREGLAVDAQGRFTSRFAGTDRVRLVPWHPLLVPASRNGTAEVDPKSGPVALRMEHGRLATFRPRWKVPAVAEEHVAARVFLFHGPVTGEPVSRHLVRFHDGTASFAGFETGTYTLWVDLPAVAEFTRENGGRSEAVVAPLPAARPVVLERVHLGDGVTDIGEVAVDPGLSIRVEVDGRDPLRPEDVVVTVTALDAPAYVRSVHTLGRRYATAGGLAPGRFHVVVRVPPHRRSIFVSKSVLHDGTVTLDGSRDTVELRVDQR